MYLTSFYINLGVKLNKNSKKLSVTFFWLFNHSIKYYWLVLYGSCNRTTTKGASKVCIIWKSRRHKIYTNFSFASLNMKYWLLLLATKFMKLAMLLCPHKVILMFCPQTPTTINDGSCWQATAEMLLFQFTALGDTSHRLYQDWPSCNL